jgi:hypothetical protein
MPSTGTNAVGRRDVTVETAADAPQRWFFVHLHKTAGTTLLVRLRRQFPGRATYPSSREQRATPGGHLGNENIERLRRDLDELGDELRMVTGHYPLCVTDVLGVPFTTLTVLREPVERTLSALRDMQRNDPKFQGWSLTEIYDHPIRFALMVHNHMVKMLGMRADEMVDGLLTPLAFEDRHLEAACRALDERIDVWGLQEDFESFCDELRRRYGWDLGPPIVRNATTPVDVDDDFRARIARDNELDVELYRYAVERREQRRVAGSTTGSGSGG